MITKSKSKKAGFKEMESMKALTAVTVGTVIDHRV